MAQFIFTLLVLAGMVVLFLIFRKIVLWYWRMDEMAENLKLILAELKKMSGKIGHLTQGEK